MARLEPFDRVAKRMLHGSEFRNAEFYRVIKSTGVGEYVRIVNGEVVEYTRAPHDDEERPSARQPKSRGRVNDLELRGVVFMDGCKVEYYGTDKGWQRFKEDWNGH